MSPEYVILLLNLVDHLAATSNMTRELREEYELLSGNVRTMVAEERDPTPEESVDLNERIASASDRLRRAQTRLNTPYRDHLPHRPSSTGRGGPDFLFDDDEVPVASLGALDFLFDDDDGTDDSHRR
jgi:hypothetical protein